MPVSKMYVFIVGAMYSSPYHTMFHSKGWGVTHRIEDADLIQFTGGEDVSPHLYGELPHSKTFTNPSRDKYEALVFHAGIYHNLPMAGICRGGQFLNVMCGGKLWQDVNNHAGVSHVVTDVIESKTFKATSTHHQMMIPGEEGLVIGVAAESTQRERMGETTSRAIRFMSNRNKDDVEIVFYEKQNAFCFQPHPEMHGVPELKDIYFDYLKTYLELPKKLVTVKEVLNDDVPY